jgi:hypothetical protein
LGHSGNLSGFLSIATVHRKKRQKPFFQGINQLRLVFLAAYMAVSAALRMSSGALSPAFANFTPMLAEH